MNTTIAHIAFGSNIGNRTTNIAKALRLLDRLKGVHIQKVSRVYETVPVGGPPQGNFLNGVVKVRTQVLARSLLEKMKKIEKKLGRRKTSRWGPRSIDLDLLTYGKLKTENLPRRQAGRKLTLPHPRYHQRKFVLVPFCEISPSFKHPVLGASNRVLLRRLTRQLTPGGQKVTIKFKWNGTRFCPFKRKKRPKTP